MQWHRLFQRRYLTGIHVAALSLISSSSTRAMSSTHASALMLGRTGGAQFELCVAVVIAAIFDTIERLLIQKNDWSYSGYAITS